MASQSEVFFESVRNFSQGEEVLLITGNTEICEKLVSQAKPLAPVDEGVLRNSIQFRTSDGNSGGFNDSPGESASEKLETPPKGTALFGATANYAIPVEFGTRNQAPQPYMRPAIAAVAGRPNTEIIKAINKDFDKWLKTTSKKKEKL